MPTQTTEPSLDARTLSKALWNAWDGSHPAPMQGENTDEVLAEIGLTADQIATLRDKGIV